MFLAHLPAGYLLTRGLLTLPGARALPDISRQRLLATGLIASVLPDFDMFYFYLFSSQQINHRAFPSHWPLVWLALFAIAALLLACKRARIGHWFNFFLLANVQLHFVLDTIVGSIRWLEPFDHTRFTWMHLPRTSGVWFWKSAGNIYALLELAIILAAVWLAWQTITQHRLQKEN